MTTPNDQDPGSPYGLKTTLVVGMEIHVELDTRSKMWTAAPNVAHPGYFDAEPNTLLSPIVIGMPGTLPVMNHAAVEMSVLVGLALNCEIATRCKWDRKSYWYPDLPKNYQISQIYNNVGGGDERDGGTLELLRSGRRVRATRLRQNRSLPATARLRMA